MSQVSSWLGAPIYGVGRRSIGAVTLWAPSGRVFAQPDLTLVSTVLASSAIALENARLLELLSLGKKEWEQTVDAIGDAFCVVDHTGIVHRANRAFGLLARRPLTALARRQWSALLPEAFRAGALQRPPG